MSSRIVGQGFSLLLAASSLFAATSDTRLIDALKRRDVKSFDTLLAQHADVSDDSARRSHGALLGSFSRSPHAC